MSLFLGGSKNKVKPQFTGLSVQTSTGAVPIPLWYGKNRGAPNIIWQDDFQSHKQKQTGKGGGGKGVDSYTYSASFILGLCWGEINNITKVWKDQSTEADFSSLGFSLFKGTNPQAPWGYLTSAHPTAALGYPNIAYLATQNYDLGQSNSFPQHSFEAEALLYNTGVGGTVPDADPALLIQDYLANPIHGVGFDLSVLSNLESTPDAPTTGDSTFQTYCRAMGFALSPFLSTQEQAGATLSRWVDLCNTAVAWTGYSLKLHPYGSDEVTANGVTYLPDFPIRYSIGFGDVIYSEGEDPVTFDRNEPADAYNAFSIVISNAANSYNDKPVQWRDQGLVDEFGLKNADSMDAKEVTSAEMAAIMVTYMGQRKAYIRNKFKFKLPPSYCRLEPADILEVTTPRLGTFLVMITDITEDDVDDLEIEADEYFGSISGKTSTQSQATSNNPINTNVPPGPVNPPVIFEPPSSLASSPQVWAAISGGDGTIMNPNWGGAFVYISTDNVKFDKIGEVDQSSRQGILTAGLATYGGTNPDTVHTLSVSLLMSGGELEDASPDDAEAGVTVSYVGGELLSYETTNLTGTDAYDLTDLWRGQYGSTIGAHLTNDQFARLDNSIFKYNLPADYIGKTLYLKFQSFNIFGGAVEDLSTCAVYTIVTTGAGFGTGTDGKPKTPTGLSGSAGSVFAKLTWTANSVNDNVTGYQVWRATGASQPFGSATLINTTTAAASEYVDASVTAQQAYTYFLVAVNVIGDSANTSGINLTPTASTAPQPYGFAFGQTPVVSKNLAYFDTPLAWTIPTGLTDAQGTIVDNDTDTAVAPTSQTDFDIQSPPGTSIGTMRFATSSLTATFIKASSTSVPLGQITQIVAPSNLNGIKGKITGSIKGTR